MAGLSLAHKIIKEHLVEGELIPGKEIGIKVDHTLTQDATGTMAYLQLEALQIPRVQTKRSVSYVDHNMLQTGFENADDHRFLQSVAAKYGILYSRPGNGICHQVQLERFSEPGCTLLGTDSHTPTSGGMGTLAIGAGGLDVAVCMGGGAFYFKMPKVLGVKLTGKLKPWVTAKDVILEMLRRLTVKGGVDKIVEYHGPGVKSLTVTERATISNMGAELGATTSLFPSDENTKEYLVAQGRGKSWKKMEADKDAKYDESIEIDLGEVEPLIAKPQSPDNVVKVGEEAGKKVAQVCVGSCTNSSYKDLMIVAKMLKGKKVHPDVSMTITPGSKQVFEEISRSGALTDMIAAGARIIESACGPCIGMGQSPPTGGISVRSFNRNFAGRSGTQNDLVYLSSPETATACAIEGVIADPRGQGKYPKITIPKKFVIDDSGIIRPPADGGTVEVVRGPNIKPLPIAPPLDENLEAEVLIKTGENVTTDHILPAGAKILPLRSNVPAISEFVFCNVDAGFVKRAKEKGKGLIVGGENYGQGSSREHAALAPMYLGVRAVITKNFARIHKANLINFGITPLEFENPKDYDEVSQGDVIKVEGLKKAILSGATSIKARNTTQDKEINLKIDLTARLRKIVAAGGLLNYTRQQTMAAKTEAR